MAPAASHGRTRMTQNPRPGLPWAVWIIALVVLAALAAGGLYALIRFDGIVLLARLNRWLAETFIERMGYAGVFLLMLIESSFIPFPSEIIIPPAGDLARRLPDWSLTGVIAAGVLGSLGGALINYYLARYLGRPVLLRLIHRFGSYVRLSEAGYFKAEQLFARHGAISTFTGRLIPGIRQIISLPAGLSGMNLMVFSVLTSLGAGIWVVMLALLGYWFGGDPEALGATLKSYSHWLIGGTGILVVAYGLWSRLGKRGA